MAAASRLARCVSVSGRRCGRERLERDRSGVADAVVAAAGAACGKIRQLTCAPLLAETFKRISKGDSVMSLFID